MRKNICIIAAVLAVGMCFTACSKKSDEDKKEIETVTKQTKIPGKEEEAEVKDEVVADVNKDDTDAETPETPSAPEASAAEENTLSSHAASDVDLSQVRSAILQKEGIEDAMLLDADAMSGLYGIDLSQIKQAAGFVTMSGTFPHEIIMIEAVNVQSAASIEAALNTKLSEVMNQARSYDAENYALAQKCKVSKKGNFVSLFLSPKQAEINTVYGGYVK